MLVTVPSLSIARIAHLVRRLHIGRLWTFIVWSRHVGGEIMGLSSERVIWRAVQGVILVTDGRLGDGELKCRVVCPPPHGLVLGGSTRDVGQWC